MKDDEHDVGDAYISGTISLSFDGQQTNELPHDASPEVVQDALESLCTITNLSVSRTLYRENTIQDRCERQGYAWFVTFMTPGDQHRRHESPLNTHYSHKLSVDGTYLLACCEVSLQNCTADDSIFSSIGTKQEVQDILLGSNNFSLSLHGHATDVIGMNSSIGTIQGELDDLQNILGTINVHCETCSGSLIDDLIPGKTYYFQISATN